MMTQILKKALVGSDVKDAVEDGGGDTSQFFMGLSAALAF